MTLLLSCQNLAKAHGSKELFQDVSFGICRGDKIGLIGPNGSGKSTLLKILAGIETPDSGSIAYKKSVRIGYVPQVASYPAQPIEEFLLEAYSDQQTPLHEKQTNITILLSKLGFSDLQQNAQTLSGGWKKRLDIAKELINSPDILLLDEPTNHLDLEGIIWLETFLKSESIAILVTSHDRYFLQNVATRMLELNPAYPQGVFAVEGTFADFLEKREEFLNYQKQCERTLASKVRGELEWLRQSPKARTTKSQARVQSADKMIQNLSEIRTRNKSATAKIDFDSSERQTRKLLAAKNLNKTLAGRVLFSNLDLTIAPGMRLGIVGANGSGKTTLLKLLAGEILPDKGTIKYADDLKIVYFDQHRQKLPPEATLRSALAPNSDTVVYRGQHIHVNSWAKRFLFPPDRLDLPVAQLSGGERARIQIARLMLQPADLLLLDEPTNDLDIATLETLEESLNDFPGAIVLISHDRALLDNLTTCILGLGGNSKEIPLFADYAQWESFVEKQRSEESVLSKKICSEKQAKPASAQAPKKLSYHEKKELEAMEKNILAVEKEIENLQITLQEHTLSNNLDALHIVCQQLSAANEKHEKLFHRWQELETKMKSE